jgi:maltose phosphorylase
MSDITIDGDVKAQQGIQQYFQLNQTYLGKDSRLNIEKALRVRNMGLHLLGYRAYCIPFYMATKDQSTT